LSAGGTPPAVARCERRDGRKPSQRHQRERRRRSSTSTDSASSRPCVCTNRDRISSARRYFSAAVPSWSQSASNRASSLQSAPASGAVGRRFDSCVARQPSEPIRQTGAHAVAALHSAFPPQAPPAHELSAVLLHVRPSLAADHIDLDPVWRRGAVSVSRSVFRLIKKIGSCSRLLFSDPDALPC
jgi:hypothetical protein